MPGEFVESRIKYYKMRREIYAKGGSGEIHIGVRSDGFPITSRSIQKQNNPLPSSEGIRRKEQHMA